MDFQVTSNKTYQGRQCGLSPFEFYRTFEMSTQGKDTNMHTLKAHRNSSPHGEVRNMDTHAGIASCVDFVRPLETTLGFTFADPFLLAEAMTHTSFSQEHPTCPHNERLEFLGDAVIGMIVAEYLIKRFPTWREGRMTNNRKKLVCDDSLDAHAKHLQIHKILRIGSKLAMQLKPTVWNAMHACAYESLFGAMFLDKNGGYDACMEFFLKDFQNDLEEIGFDSEEFNPKGDLIEFVQHFGQHIVKYDHFKQTLKNSTPLFSCYVVIGGTRFSVGDGPSKRRAEENAAEAALTQKKQIRQQLEKHPEFTEKLKARTALDKAKRRRLDDRQDGKEVVQQRHQHAQ